MEMKKRSKIKELMLTICGFAEIWTLHRYKTLAWKL